MHIQPEYRVGDVSNFRKVKKEYITTLKKLLPDNVLLDRKGNRDADWYMERNQL